MWEPCGGPAPEALQAFQKVLELEPDNAQGREGLDAVRRGQRRAWAVAHPMAEWGWFVYLSTQAERYRWQYAPPLVQTPSLSVCKVVNPLFNRHSKFQVLL